MLFVLFITVAMFLCLSYLLYCELKDIEGIVCSSFVLTVIWLLLRMAVQIAWCRVGNIAVSFWDLSIGLLVLTASFCLLKMFLRWLMAFTSNMRKRLIDIALEIGQDKLLAYTLLSLLLLYAASLLKMNCLCIK